MGLDSVEMVMETEEEFGISLADEEVEVVVTVGDLVALVLSKVRSVSGGCITRTTFFRLRQSLERSATGITRLRPSSRLVDVLPPSIRRATWSQLRQEYARLPGLQPKDSSRRWIHFVGWVVAAVPIFATWWCATGWGAALFGLFVSSSLAVAAFAMVVQALSTEFPASMATLGDLTRSLAPVVWEEGRPPPRDEVLARVQRLTCRQLGVPASKVNWDTRFIDDLGMD